MRRRRCNEWKAIHSILSAAAFRNTILSSPTEAARKSCERYRKLGARNCHPIYNALDPEAHHPELPDPAMSCDLLFLGNRLPDRERRVEQFFLRAAELAPEMSFILGGEGWAGKAMPANVRWIGHVGTAAHNRVNASARMALNINRESMANVGFSPPTRVFEAAGAGVCLITDKWCGIEQFFEPGREILVARSAEEIVGYPAWQVRGGSRRDWRCHAGARVGRTYLRTTRRRGAELFWTVRVPTVTRAPWIQLFCKLQRGVPELAEATESN